MEDNIDLKEPQTQQNLWKQTKDPEEQSNKCVIVDGKEIPIIDWFVTIEWIKYKDMIHIPNFTGLWFYTNEWLAYWYWNWKNWGLEGVWKILWDDWSLYYWNLKNDMFEGKWRYQNIYKIWFSWNRKNNLFKNKNGKAIDLKSMDKCKTLAEANALLNSK